MASSGIETLGDIVMRNATLHPQRTAIIYAGRNITYRDFSARAFRLANAFYGLGLRRQDRVAILAQNSLEYLEFYAACETAGFIAVPVNYRLAPPEARQILRDCDPQVLLFEPEYAETVAALRSDLPGVRHFVATGSGAPDWASGYETLLAAASPEPPPIRARPDDIAYVFYTSGTTGRPKGAMLDHAGQVGFIHWQALDLNTRHDDRILLVMPFYHIGAKCNQLAYSLRGATVILHRAYDIAAVARSIEQDRATIAHLAPLMVQDLLNVPDLDRYDHASLRVLQYASGPMAVAPLRRAVARYGSIFVQVYGMTETGSGSILQPHDHILDGTPEQVRRLGSAGQATLGYKLRIVRPDGTECAPEEPGEVLVKGPGVMRGYWNNHPASVEALEDGWMHTGDVGFLDKDNYLFIVDRKKDMILSGGENIYPREVEEAIYFHPAVEEVAVIGVPDQRWGEAVKAFVVPRPGASVTAEEIIEHCRKHVASYKKPKSVEFLTGLPRLPNKKIDKKQLRAPYWDNQNRNV